MSIEQITSGGISDNIEITLSSTTTASKPALNFSGDENTGIFQATPESLSIAISGTEVIRFDSTGIKNGNLTSYGVQNPDFSKGAVLYVNGRDLNADDSIYNSGGTLQRPFKTIERALLEVSKRSYVIGNIGNDQFQSFSIFVYPGEYIIDNRPGVKSSVDLPTAGNFENELYKFNPVAGGIIVPRGTSLVGEDLRKTIIRPRYVPAPDTTVPGIMLDAAYMIEKNRGYIQQQVSLFIEQTYTANVNSTNPKCRRDIGYIIDAIVADLRAGGNAHCFLAGEAYTSGTALQHLSPTESTVAIAAFDKVRDIAIAALNNWTGLLGAYTEITVGKTINRTTFTPGSGYYTNGDCSNASSAVTSLVAIINGIISNPSTYFTTFTRTQGINEQSAIFKLTGGSYVTGLTFKDATGTPYNGVTYSVGVPTFTTAANAQYSHHRVVGFAFPYQKNQYSGELSEYYKKIDAWDTITDNGQQREVINGEYTIVGDLQNAVLANTVSSASPYIFSVSLLSIYGLCGVIVDGDAVADGSLKSMVMAQFTNVSLQTDPAAFVVDTNDNIDGTNYKESYKHYAYKGKNDAYIQLVSCFAIGNARHYYTASGAEFSITNSCSNFGGVSLYSEGYSRTTLPQDVNYNIVKIIPPKVINSDYTEFNIGNLDATTVTATSVGTTSLAQVAPIEFLNDSYIYVRVPDPSNPTQQLDLQARLVSAGNTLTSGTFNVVDVNSSINRNAIYRYINLIGVLRYESAWYNSSNPPIGGLPAAEATETANRIAQLTNANIFVQRILDTRSVDDRNYHLLVSTPTNSRPPTINYVLSQLKLNSLSTDRYYVAKIEEYTPSATILPFSRNYKITVLRVNPNDGVVSDLLEDIDLTTAYKNLLSNIDPRLFDPSELIDASYDATGISRLTMDSLLTNFGYSNPQITTLLTPSNTETALIAISGTENVALVGDVIKFDLIRPSIIRCSGHTWEFVGYRNYSTGLPKLQQNTLPIGVRLSSIQTTKNGGQIYATGMDELGNEYRGREVTNIASGITTNIRFDGLQQTTQNPNNASNNFNNINVSGTGTINNIKSNSVTLGSLNFQSSSAFKLNSGGVLSDLVQANTPNGIKANSSLGTYGLVRHATGTELTNRSGEGYLSPPDLSNVDADISYINGLITALNSALGSLDSSVVKLTGNQVINGIKQFGSSIVIPDAILGNQTAAWGQVLGELAGVAALSAANLVTSTGRIVINSTIQILFGTQAITGDWQAGGALTTDILFSSISGSVAYTGTPVAFTGTNRLVTQQNNITPTKIEYIGDQAGLAQPNDGIISWIAIGYI
jgi:hypothetical protein